MIFSQGSDFYENFTTYCQVPIDGFDVVFTPSRTVQDPNWSPIIYLAADTTANTEEEETIRVEEMLTATITTSQGNPIDYYVDWTGLEICNDTIEALYCIAESNETVASE